MCPELFVGEPQVFLVALLQRFQKLRVMVSCLEQLFPCEVLDDDGMQAKSLARIRHLELYRLPEMTNIWSEHSEFDQILQNLKSLRVGNCHGLISSLAPSTALLPNLTHLDVYECKQLIKFLTSSSARSLGKLEKMTVKGCKSLTEIVWNDEDDEEDDDSKLEDNNDIVFGKLEELRVESLTSLTSFCSTRNCNFKFPSLHFVHLEKCPNMAFFSTGVLDTPRLKEVCFKKGYMKDDVLWEGDCNSKGERWYNERSSR